MLKFICTLLLLFGTPISSSKVLDFAPAKLSPSGFGSVLTNLPEESFPDHFIICSSIKHSKINAKSPFVLLGENEKPWLAFSFWNYDTGVILWAEIQGTWTKLDNVDRPWTHVWIHLCADVDTITGNFSVSLNGKQPMMATNSKLVTNKPKKITTRLEVRWNQNSIYAAAEVQFIGSLTNLNIFYSSQEYSLVRVSKKPCTDGDYMAWSKIEFKQEVEAMKVTEDDNVCTAKDSYDIVLPMMASWHEADHQCKGLGLMTQVENPKQLNSTVELVERSLLPCTGIWMPISDEDEEGVFKDTNSGDLVTYIPWREDQPNGGPNENFVGIILQDTASYWDLPGKYKLCVSCNLKATTSFNLRGLCKGTKLGW